MILKGFEDLWGNPADRTDWIRLILALLLFIALYFRKLIFSIL